jgi:chromate reductase
MITVISATNRPESNTIIAALHYAERLKALHSDIPVEFLSLCNLSSEWFHSFMYNKDGMHQEIQAIQDQYMFPSTHFVFVMPEYNGSYPGVLKLFVDALSIRRRNDVFKGKKALLVGVADGRAGNLRGMEDFTGVLNYLGTVVYPNKLPLSSFGKLLDDNRMLADPGTLNVIEQHVQDFLNF